MDRLTSIAAFVRVVENGGFTAAARHLNVSPTMVSNHVHELEDRLGARLLNRTTRRVSLTEIGRAYYERSAHILADLDEADRAAGTLQATPRGRLRVHCYPVLARFIAPIVTAYLRDYPEVLVDLRRGDQIIDLLEEGFDLAMRPMCLLIQVSWCGGCLLRANPERAMVRLRTTQEVLHVHRTGPLQRHA
jgi:DNA-binding transcriptional LysR family regulator